MAVLLLLGAAGAAAAWFHRASAADPADRPPPPLQFSADEVTRPQRLPMPQRVEFSGPLVAPDTAVVRAKAAGTLLSLAVAEGHRVRAGQAIGRLDLAELQSRVDDRAAGVQQADAMLAEARRQHESNLGLADQNFISGVALQSSQARLEAARAQLRSAQAQLAASRIGVRDAALLAPIAGIVGKRHALPGEKLAAEQPLLTIVNLKSLELAGMVATHEVSLLQPGLAVQVTVEGRGEPVAGRIDRVAPTAEAGTRAIGVVVALDNADERLRAGQYARAQVTVDDPTPRLSLPLDALSQAAGQEQVWTIEGGALVRRIVVTGRRDPATGRVEVLRGLDPEALVLATRFDNLKEGALAGVAGAGPATPAAARQPLAPPRQS